MENLKTRQYGESEDQAMLQSEDQAIMENLKTRQYGELEDQAMLESEDQAIMENLKTRQYGESEDGESEDQAMSSLMVMQNGTSCKCPI